MHIDQSTVHRREEEKKVCVHIYESARVFTSHMRRDVKRRF